jgi:hypothetical protein
MKQILLRGFTHPGLPISSRKSVERDPKNQMAIDRLKGMEKN